MDWVQTLTSDSAISGPVVVFGALALASALALALTSFWGIWTWTWKRDRRNPCVIASVEAIPSLRSEGSYKAIRIVLCNRSETAATVEEIILSRPPGWFEFGIVGPLVRLNGLAPWRLNVGMASRETVRFPVNLDVNASWESVIPLELENLDNPEEARRLERYKDAVKVLRSGEMRYSIQLTCPVGPHQSPAMRNGAHTIRNLDGRVSLASY